MRQIRFASPVAAATVETAAAMETSDMEASAEGRSCVEGEGPRYTAAIEAVVGPIAHSNRTMPRATI
jgi:hypothetical protein